MTFSSSLLVNTPSALHILPAFHTPYKPLQDHQSLSLLSKCKNMESFKQLHSQFIKTGLHNTHFGLSKLVEFCAINPCGDLSYALLIFDTIEEPSQIIWNTIIRGHALSASPVLAVKFYARMLSFGSEPNSYTFPCLLKSCAKFASIREGKQVHGHVLKLGFEYDVFVHTSLINMYAHNGELGCARLVFDKSPHRDAVSFTALVTGYISMGYLDDARQLFDEIPIRDVVSWNAMISGYARMGEFDEALAFFQEMQRLNVAPNESTIVSILSACAQSGSIELGNRIRSWVESHGLGSNRRIINALIDMYLKCDDLDTAHILFEGMQVKDLVSWNVMIGGYMHMSRYGEALGLFRQMQLSNLEPNEITFLSILPACALLGALDLGKWIHAYIDKNLHSVANASLWTSVVDMYAKCGSIEPAQQVFNGLKTKTLSSYNAMISCLAMHGHAHEALSLFAEMANRKLEPDDITFVGVLSACSHAGLVDLGRQHFKSMINNYKISPKLQHYGCMIDLLGRAGLFAEAKNLIENMEMSPDTAIWVSLLGSCRVHKNVELGEYAAFQILELDPKNTGAHVLLSNIYARAGRWDDMAQIRTKLNDEGMKKVPGSTSIEVDGVVHEFVVTDKSHCQSEDIYRMLDEIDRLLEVHGYVPNTSQVLYDIDDEEWKEESLSQHSERLAIAYGLISTKRGTRIRIVKNLRTCENCHSAIKLISRIFDREIIARDRNRFHHFKNGSCSCMDYW